MVLQFFTFHRLLEYNRTVPWTCTIPFPCNFQKLKVSDSGAQRSIVIET
jgi:hypothetical protein